MTSTESTTGDPGLSDCDRIVEGMTTSDSGPSYLDTAVKVGLSLIPYAGGVLQVLNEDTRDRHAAKIRSTIEDVATRAGAPLLSRRLAEDPEVEALFVQGVEAASRSGYEAKRRLLARVVADAVEDEAQVEPAQLMVQALTDIEAPHVHALRRLRHVEDTTENDAHESRASAVCDAGRREAIPVIAVLIRTGLTTPATFATGGIGVVGVTSFGRAMLDDLAEYAANDETEERIGE